MIELKVCGMKQVPNIKEVAALQPDYLGFIFYDKSERNFEGIIPELPKKIKKVGVFVDEYLEIVVSLAEEYKLQYLQLHGKESPEYLKQLKEHLPKVQLVKAFSVGASFDFDLLKAYEQVADMFLFDTKGKHPGGNGVQFDWTLLEGYPSEKPFFLSGGIGVKDLAALKEFLKSPAARYCRALDVNSKFEKEPGLKRVPELQKFIKLLK
ncbi:N-(5'-phosphoribosyl)anthranilate isomerase [Tenacibaculum litopenaei]|uniref:phosphoribosylanthranilate isomerase n=1 Tax=Tenacibaculum litopenaei TaxID=396016 RepID=UPI00389324DA